MSQIIAGAPFSEMVPRVLDKSMPRQPFDGLQERVYSSTSIDNIVGSVNSFEEIGFFTSP